MCTRINNVHHVALTTLAFSQVCHRNELFVTLLVGVVEHWARGQHIKVGPPPLQVSTHSKLENFALIGAKNFDLDQWRSSEGFA